MFVTFTQNNSGGYFMQDEDVDVFVIIEGNDLNDILGRAREIFSDYREYCDCCGERWDDDWKDEEDLDDEPMIYGTLVWEYKCNYNKGDGIVIHYLNGTKEHITIMEKELEIERQEKALTRGKTRVALDIQEDGVYFIYGLDKYKMPNNIKSYTSETDKFYATRKGSASIVLPGETYIVFESKDGRVSDRFNLNLGSKIVYEKCLEFANDI